MTWRPAPQDSPCYCGNPIPPDGPTDLYCTPACQAKWLHRGHDREPVPARKEWRRNVALTPAVPTRWPDPPTSPTYRIHKAPGSST